MDESFPENRNKRNAQQRCRIGQSLHPSPNEQDACKGKAEKGKDAMALAGTKPHEGGGGACIEQQEILPGHGQNAAKV